MSVSSATRHSIPPPKEMLLRLVIDVLCCPRQLILEATIRNEAIMEDVSSIDTKYESTVAAREQVDRFAKTAAVTEANLMRLERWPMCLLYLRTEMEA